MNAEIKCVIMFLTVCGPVCMSHHADDWLRDGSEEYLFVDETRTWCVALEYCTTKGGHLARFPEAAIAEDITNYFTTQTIWLDVNDIAEEGTYVYSDGSELQWRDWGRDEPSDDPNNDCIVYNENRKMRDRSCNASNVFICERVIHTTQTTTLVSSIRHITDGRSTDPINTAETSRATESTITEERIEITAWDLNNITDINYPSTYSDTSDEMNMVLIAGVSVALLVLLFNAFIIVFLCARKHQKKLSPPRANTTPSTNTYENVTQHISLSQGPTLSTNITSDQATPEATSANIQENHEHVEADNKMIANHELSKQQPLSDDTYLVDNVHYSLWDGQRGLTRQTFAVNTDDTELLDNPQYSRWGTDNDVTSPTSISHGDSEDVMIDNQQYAAW